jgi:hypothetical protein
MKYIVCLRINGYNLLMDAKDDNLSLVENRVVINNFL